MPKAIIYYEDKIYYFNSKEGKIKVVKMDKILSSFNDALECPVEVAAQLLDKLVSKDDR